MDLLGGQRGAGGSRRHPGFEDVAHKDSNYRYRYPIFISGNYLDVSELSWERLTLFRGDALFYVLSEDLRLGSR